jgi:hypothetical protein
MRKKKSMSYFQGIKMLLNLSLLWICCLNSVEARFATRQDSPVEYAFYNRDITVSKDGRSEETISYQVNIKNEKGRAGYATQSFRYNGNIQTLEIISAETIVDGQIFPVPKDTIETKPLASPENGFDQAYQVLVSYPNVVVGASITLKYRLITKQQPLPHYFATEFYFGQTAYWLASHVTVKSALPFYVHVNDPNKALKIEQSQKENEQYLSIELIKPVYTALINEVTLGDNEKNVYVDISTIQKVEKIGSDLAGAYQKVIEQPLPSSLANIQKKAASLKDNSIDQINFITSKLAENIRYMGDWRSIDGQFKPRNLDTIARTGVSDCKDYAVSLAAILRTLGYEAYAALVYRGEGYYPETQDLPSIAQFNHAIVYATDPRGKNFWLDPTNFVSMAQGIFPDIADRPALVLNPKKPLYAHIPAILPQNNRIEGNKIVKLGKEGQLSSAGTMTLKGEAAIPVTGATLQRSEASIKEALVDILSGEKNPMQKRIDLPNLNSRIVQDTTIGYAFVQEDASMTTNVGQALDLGGMWAGLVLNTTEDQEGITYFGIPKSETQVLLLAGVKAKSVEKLNANIQSPWMTFTRDCQVNDQGVKITEKTEILHSFIKADVIRTPEFQALKKHVKQAVVGVAVVVE